jgi:predicted dehydrogenase
MGREFASAAARWSHLTDVAVRPEIIALCSTYTESFDWFTSNFPLIRQTTCDYRELLANADVECVYCAVPHNLHEEIYCAIIAAGKHLIGEKPFGIDLPANQRILNALADHPEVFARCVSQFPFFPAVQQIGTMIERGRFGRLIEVNAGFLHSSDMDPNKPINWKRSVATNGEYGVMGDLGMHACHFPFRAGWQVRNVHAVLSNIIPTRRDGHGGMAVCDTWDNAVLLCQMIDPVTGAEFPLNMRLERIAPGETNTWYIEIYGTQASARFTTRNPRRLELLEYQPGHTQNWQQLDLGYQTAFKTITGDIFEFGFCDAILQMWAAYLEELTLGQTRGKFLGCALPEEASMSHRLFTSALQSQQSGRAMAIE